MSVRRRVFLLIIPLAVAIALIAQGVRVLRRGGESLELPPQEGQDVAAIDAMRVTLERSKVSFDVSGVRVDKLLHALSATASIQVTLSPEVDRWFASGDLPRAAMQAQDAPFRELLERLLRAADGPRSQDGWIASALRSARRSVRREKGRLRYRIYPRRVHVRLEDERCPSSLVPGALEDEYLSPRDGATMVYVSGAKNDEKQAFLVDKHEVTVARYRRFLEAIAREGHVLCSKLEPKNKDHRPDGWGGAEYAKLTSGDDGPVLGVDVWDARAYAAWAGKRLPTSLEWARAAYGDDGRTHPWGNEAPDAGGAFRANGPGDRDGFALAAPVGSFPLGASAFGALDMEGNAAELALPFAPDLERVYPTIVGGSFETTSEGACSDEVRDRTYGFRCVMDWPKP